MRPSPGRIVRTLVTGKAEDWSIAGKVTKTISIPAGATSCTITVKRSSTSCTVKDGEACVIESGKIAKR
jgi:hypothetical protein